MWGGLSNYIGRRVKQKPKHNKCHIPKRKTGSADGDEDTLKPHRFVDLLPLCIAEFLETWAQGQVRCHLLYSLHNQLLYTPHNCQVSLVVHTVL